MRKQIIKNSRHGKTAEALAEFGTNRFMWNGQKIKAAKLVNYVVQPPDGEIEISDRSWIWPFVGKIRQGIIVHAAQGDPFMIDNEDGTGYLKLANGGKVAQGHKPGVGKVVEDLPWSECVTVFKTDLYREAIVLNYDKMNEVERKAADLILESLDKLSFTEISEGKIKKMTPISTPRIKPRFIKRQLKHEQYRKKD
jgi:hypothetical protein